MATAAAILSGVPQPACYFVLALLAATTLYAGFRFHTSALVPLAHLFAAFPGLSFLAASEVMAREGPFDRFAVVFAGVFGVALVMAALLRRSRERLAYLAAAFIILHMLLATELGAVPGARWLASAAYAVIGSGLILVGLSRSQLLLQRAGMMSLALLVGRLFLFDLENAGFGVRIILFMFCGFAFLGLSYVFRERRRLA